MCLFLYLFCMCVAIGLFVCLFSGPNLVKTPVRTHGSSRSNTQRRTQMGAGGLLFYVAEVERVAGGGRPAGGRMPTGARPANHWTWGPFRALAAYLQGDESRAIHISGHFDETSGTIVGYPGEEQPQAQQAQQPHQQAAPTGPVQEAETEATGSYSDSDSDSDAASVSASSYASVSAESIHEGDEMMEVETGDMAAAAAAAAAAEWEPAFASSPPLSPFPSPSSPFDFDCPSSWSASASPEDIEQMEQHRQLDEAIRTQIVDTFGDDE